MFGTVLKAMNSYFRKGMTFCRYLTQVERKHCCYFAEKFIEKSIFSKML